MAKSKLSFFAGILSVSLAGCVGQHDDKKGDILSDDILNKEVDLANHFLRHSHWSRKIEEICKTYNMPCGIEESPEDPIPEAGAGQEVFSFDSPHITVRQFLDKIAALHPAYQWSYRGGVLNIIPRDGKEYRINNNIALGRKTKKIYVKDKIPPVAVELICVENGVIQPAKPNWNPGFKRLIKDVTTRPTLLRLNFKGITVREALNKIVRSDPRIGFWKFHFDTRENVGEYRIEYESWLY